METYRTKLLPLCSSMSRIGSISSPLPSESLLHKAKHHHFPCHSSYDKQQQDSRSCVIHRSTVTSAFFITYSVRIDMHSATYPNFSLSINLYPSTSSENVYCPYPTTFILYQCTSTLNYSENHFNVHNFNFNGTCKLVESGSLIHIDTSHIR